jgi:hypothetical protein
MDDVGQNSFKVVLHITRCNSNRQDPLLSSPLVSSTISVGLIAALMRKTVNLDR